MVRSQCLISIEKTTGRASSGDVQNIFSSLENWCGSTIPSTHSPMRVMRISEVSPKCKNFSRRKSLQYPISTTIGTRDFGEDFVVRVPFPPSDGSIPTSHFPVRMNPSPPLLDYSKNEKERRNKKKARDNHVKNEMARAHEAEAKETGEISFETNPSNKDGTHQSGIIPRSR